MTSDRGAGRRSADTDAPGSADTEAVSAPQKVTVAVHNGRCHRFGICVQEAPEVFTLHGEHRLSYDGSPAPELAAGVRQAARLCPMQAITVDQR